jgi:hypothetical protein
VKERLDSITLFIILLVGGALRFWDYSSIPLSHDEYSVLFRTGFDTWNDLIKKGVMVDTHPAGIQVFVHWWTELLGTTAWIMKLPFTLFGMASIYLTYRIGKDWFNISAGLIAAAFMASLQYPVFYSQLTRPYISGLFFCLLTTHFWSRLIQKEQNKFLQNSVLFVLSASLCTYNHHFSALVAAIIGLSGIFIIPRNRLIWYALSGIAIFLLYIPHLSIFLHQLGKGGVGAWLGKPSLTFLPEYLMYVAQFSTMTILLVLVIAFRFRDNNSDPRVKRNFLISWIWFLTPLIIGYLYSVMGSAVLQYSVLIFSFPFLLFSLFGLVKKLSARTNLTLVLVILWLNAIALIFDRQHYELMYNSIYENVLENSNIALDRNEDMITIYNSHEKISDHLVKERGFTLNREFLWYNDSANSIADLKEYIHDNKADYTCLFLGTLSRSEPLLIPVILDHYPLVSEKNDYFGGSTLVFDQVNGSSIVRHSERLELSDQNSSNWAGIDTQMISTDSVDGKPVYHFSQNEWGPSYKSNLGENTETNDLLDIRIEARSTLELNEALIVSSIEKDGENIHWSASPLKQFYSESKTANQWQFFHHTIRLADIPEDHNELTIKAFIWNKGLEDFEVKSLEVQVIEGNPIIYGLYETIDQ